MRQRNRGNLREKQKGEHEDTVCWWHALPLAAGGSDRVLELGKLHLSDLPRAEHLQHNSLLRHITHLNTAVVLHSQPAPFFPFGSRQQTKEGEKAKNQTAEL